MMYTIHTDGGSRGNPGHSAAGIIIEYDSSTYSFGTYLGITTNNIAEYTAVKLALEYLLNKPDVKRGEIHFFLDSELVVKQLTGVYAIKNKLLGNLAKEITKKINEWGSAVTFTHIPRIQNKAADALVNKTLDTYLSQH